MNRLDARVLLIGESRSVADLDLDGGGPCRRSSRGLQRGTGRSRPRCGLQPGPRSSNWLAVMVRTGGSGVRVALILMVSPCFCAFIDEGATAGVDVRNHSHFFNKSITTVSPLPKCVNHDLHIWGMIEPTTISTTPRVAIISPSGPPRFLAEPPSAALRRHGRTRMRSLPLSPHIRAWVSTSGRKPNPIAPP